MGYSPWGSKELDTTERLNGDELNDGVKFKTVSDMKTMLLLLLLSRFSRVRLCTTPSTAAHQAPQSLGFSRQEHWSGFPFPSTMHEK